MVDWLVEMSACWFVALDMREDRDIAFEIVMRERCCLESSRMYGGTLATPMTCCASWRGRCVE